MRAGGKGVGREKAGKLRQKRVFICASCLFRPRRNESEFE